MIGMDIFSASTLLGEELYFLSNRGIFEKINIQNYIVQTLGKLSGFSIDFSRLYGKMFFIRDKLYILFYSGTHYSVLDLKHLEYQIITFEIPIGSDDAVFYGIYQRMIYTLSYKNRLTEIDTLTGEVKSTIIESIGLKGNKGAACMVDNILWVLADHSKDLISLNVKDHSIIIHTLPFSIKNPTDLICHGNKIMILSGEGSVYKYELGSNKMITIVKLEKRIQYKGEWAFCRMVETPNRLWLMPFLGNDIYYWDKKNGEVEEYKDYPPDYAYALSPEMVNTVCKFWEYSENDRYICFSNRCANYMLVIDKREEQIKWIKWELPETEKLMFFYLNTYSAFSENDLCGVKDLINMITSERWEKVQNEKDADIGN